MALKVSAGTILRRGMTGLTPPQQVFLLENADRVQAIIDEIEARRAVFLETEAATEARVSAVAKAEADLATREAAVVTDRADLDAATAEQANKRQADMEALGRRTREVVDKEAASSARTTALDEREQRIEDHGRTRENELRAREEALETRETAADERDRSMHGRSRGLGLRELRIETAEKIMKSAAASLG